jgi:ribosomal protein S18 acetylase RimI-like enzyme
MKVRRVGAADHVLVRDLRLRALRDSPAAFGSTYEVEAAREETAWMERLATAGNAHFVAEEGQVPTGMVSLVRDHQDHRLAHLVGMWVAPRARGSGTADRLMAEALAWAREEAFVAVRLHVIDDNDRAERVYLRHGFRRTGESFRRERDGATEIEMQLDVVAHP